jgi:F-type H+-transporting ATPase subunit epsilon
VSPTAAPTLHLKVVTPRLLLVDADVEEVQVPAVDGLIGVFPGHRPLMAAIGRGTLSYLQGGEEESFAIDGGTAEIRPDRVLIFTKAVED